MLRVLQTQQVLLTQLIMEHLKSLQLQMIKSFNIQPLTLMVGFIIQVVSQVTLLIEQSIYHDSKGMIYNQTYTSIVVK